MMQTYKKWIRNVILAFSFISLSVALFNFKVDSLGLFGSSSYLEEAAKELLNGNDISGLRDYNERHFQSLIIQNQNEKIETITLGSSRTLPLKKEFVAHPNQTFFNHSVRGAGLGDYIATIGLYEKILNYTPQTVIIGIDPWVFNKGNAEFRYKVLNPYYKHIIQKLSVVQEIQEQSDSSKKRYKELINYEYTFSNIKFFKTLLKNDMKAFSLVDNPNKKYRYVKRSDGSTLTHKVSNPTYHKQTQQKAIAYTQGNVYSLSGFKKIEYTQLFESFILYLQNRGTKVVFLLPPYHPTTYDILTKNPKYSIISEVESYLKDFAYQNSIEVYGSYNPHLNNFTNSDFMDGMHAFDWVLENIFYEYKHSK